MKEHKLHSAIMFHLAGHFQQKLREELVAIETTKICPQQTTGQNGLLKLPLACAYSLIDSDDLKVDDENTVLSFIFHYTKQIKNTSQESLPSAIKAANRLARCIRYNFLSFYNVMSALRKNEAL